MEVKRDNPGGDIGLHGGGVFSERDRTCGKVLEEVMQVVFRENKIAHMLLTGTA